ncbi:hypothetical protein [Clostridium saccharoperbutylacetonicum]
MSNKTVKEIVKMVYDIYSLDFNISNYDFYDKLRKLTYSIWEINHEELLQELGELDLESNIDFQLFWYDCLGFPKEVPKSYYKNGLPAYVFYGSIPSKIYDVVSELGGFHDLNINYVTYETDLLSLFLDSRCWKTISNEKYEVKLTFAGVSKIMFDKTYEDKQEEFKIENLMGSHILSAEEIPMIEYIFNSLNLDKAYLLPKKRLIQITSEICGDFYFTFDKWTYERKN